LYSALLLFALVLVVNGNTTTAASVNQTNGSSSVIKVGNNNVLSNTTSTDTNKSANSISKVAVNSTNKPKINSTMAAGEPVKVNGLTLTQMKDGINRAESFYKKNGRLPSYLTFGSRNISITTFQKNIATQGLKINTSTNTKINGLTIAQIKEGISRAESFYKKNGRLPNYLAFGSRNISMTTFQKNVATAGLKINTSSNNKIDTSSVSALAASLKKGSSTQYETATKIFNWVRDHISYSFYYNSKYGAAGTLKKRTGNCCDTSNLMVALARAAGIQARYVHGTCKFSSGTWYGHVWAQLYVNGKWVNADGTSTRNSLGVVKNWNTATYTLHGTYQTLPF
jgi:hypothetical protein